jgi:1-acyl-sn-glycerol-3-phosphate acyltransferase
MGYYFLRVIASFVLRIFFRLQIEGRHNIPGKTNFIVVSNHASFLDPLLVMVAVPKKIFCIALRDLYKFGWLRWFLRLADALPSGSSSKKAVDLLSSGKIVGLFPEGGVSRDGRLKEFRRGVALLALKTGRPILPCAVFGTFESLPFGKRIPRLIPLKVKIGKPVYLLKEFDEHIDDLYLQKGILRVRNAVKELIDAA